MDGELDTGDHARSIGNMGREPRAGSGLHLLHGEADNAEPGIQDQDTGPAGEVYGFLHGGGGLESTCSGRSNDPKERKPLFAISTPSGPSPPAARAAPGQPLRKRLISSKKRSEAGSCSMNKWFRPAKAMKRAPRMPAANWHPASNGTTASS